MKIRMVAILLVLLAVVFIIAAYAFLNNQRVILVSQLVAIENLLPEFVSVSQNPESVPHSPVLWDLCGGFCKSWHYRPGPVSAKPTNTGAVIIPGPKVMTWNDWVSTKTVVVRRTRRKEVIPEGQMGFGI